MIINDYYELLALYKTIFEAKFHSNPNNRDIAGSPIVSKLLKSILHEVIAEQGKKDKRNIEKWDEWLKISHHMPQKETTITGERTVWDIAIANAKKDERFFGDLFDENLRKIAECYLSPFRCTNDELDLFIKSVKKQD